MKTMLSTDVGGPETLALSDMPSPEPDKNQVRIKVHAAGVNFPDTLIIRDLYQMKPPRPFAPGGEISGSGDCEDDDCEMEGSSDIPCRDCPDCEDCVPEDNDGDNECDSTPWADWTECSCESTQRERFRGCIEDGICECPDIVESEPCPEEELNECTYFDSFDLIKFLT